MIRILVVTLMLFASTVFGQEPAPKPPPPTTALSAAELEMMSDSIDQLEKAAQDVQTANLFTEAAKAKQERAGILLEARKLKLLMDRGLSDKTHEVVYVQNGVNSKTPGDWVVREKAKDKPK